MGRRAGTNYTLRDGPQWRFGRKLRKRLKGLLDPCPLNCREREMDTNTLSGRIETQLVSRGSEDEAEDQLKSRPDLEVEYRDGTVSRRSSDEMRRLMDDCVSRHYLSPKGLSIMSTYRILLCKVAEMNADRPTNRRQCAPSYSYLRRRTDSLDPCSADLARGCRKAAKRWLRKKSH